MNEAAIEKLIARQEIEDCLLRCCRSADRMDREMALSAFHEDGLDVHCSIWGRRILPGVETDYKGSPEEHTNWMFAMHGEHKTQTQHRLSNISCEIDGDVAHTECYVLHTSINHDGSMSIASARYVDRLEKRDGTWKIAVRYAFPEWATEAPVKVMQLRDMDFPFVLGKPSRDRTDPSYLRPLPDPAPDA